MACSWPCCATCCSFLSAFGVFFLLILGALMQQKSPAIELETHVMENQYLAPYICAGVYFVFFVVSCVYLFIHSRRKPAPSPGIFALGSMAEAGGRGPNRAPSATGDEHVAAADAGDDEVGLTTGRMGSSNLPLTSVQSQTGINLKKPEGTEMKEGVMQF
ncbi:transmembrane protein [Cyclospora cayetanensis]|uniref:Transmembrane protein n=1 Tax=Cyclospora cayetanensis TaxID=88456 RepID=A0A1D3D2D4_9EIME|nr:transmembrane protein [Cyclospora cayetanensis]